MPETSRSSLQTNIFDVLSEEQVFEEFNGEIISFVYEKIKENRKNGLKSLINII